GSTSGMQPSRCNAAANSCIMEAASPPCSRGISRPGLLNSARRGETSVSGLTLVGIACDQFARFGFRYAICRRPCGGSIGKEKIATTISAKLNIRAASQRGQRAGGQANVTLGADPASDNRHSLPAPRHEPVVVPENLGRDFLF